MVTGFADRRIKYVNTGCDVPGVANWNNAYRQATGQYLICIGDDDFLLPDCLESYAKAIREWNGPSLLSSYNAVYYPNDFFVKRQRNTLVIQTGDATTCLLDTAPLLESIYTTLDVPFPTQPVCYAKHLLEQISEEEGPYQPIHPDYYCLASALLHCSRCVEIRKQLVLLGRGSTSIGVSDIFTDSRKQSYAVLKDPEVMRGIMLPLAGNFFVNGHYATLQRVKLRYLNHCPYELKNLREYYAGCDYQLRLWRKRRLELGVEEAASEEKLRKLPLRVRAYLVYRRLQRYAKAVAPFSLLNLYNSFAGTRSITYKLNPSVQNIEDCANWLLGHSIRDAE